ncbi:MAG: hypothetical protein M8357_00915 [Desulfobulbaceae bacterium]|nr:hypothetical protein [Desulfobulbaceae bacterium]
MFSLTGCISLNQKKLRIGKMRLNCWEVKECGRQPGGHKSRELGVCPATTETKAHGLNGGVNGGRVCWVIDRTICHNQVQGTFTQKLKGCLQCDFYSAVRNEEGSNYLPSKEILAIVR